MEADANGLGFYNNRSIIEDGQRDGSLYVVDASGEAGPVGFHLGEPGHPDILVVRQDLRRRGHGKVLTDHFLQLAAEADVCLIDIICSPPTSIPYWESKGFHLYSDEPPVDYGARHAFKVMQSDRLMPPGRPVQVDVEVFAERRAWDASFPPLSSHHVVGVDNGGRVVLPERIPVFSPRLRSPGDLVIRVAADGQELCCCKAKYPEAAAVGVRRDSLGTRYVDTVSLSPCSGEAL